MNSLQSVSSKFNCGKTLATLTDALHKGLCTFMLIPH